MRRCLCILTVGMLCCRVSSFASAQFSLSAVSPTPAPQLFLAQSEATPAKPQVDEGAQAEKLDSPFEFLKEPTGEATNQSNMESAQFQPNSKASTESSLESPSLPVSRSPHPSSLRPNSPAATILAGAYGDHLVYEGGIDFAAHSRRTPNPTVQYMMRQWCADGLWDTYQAERAAQCALQTNRISNARHHGHCGCAPRAVPQCQLTQAGCGGAAYRGHLGFFPHTCRAQQHAGTAGCQTPAKCAGATDCDCGVGSAAAACDCTAGSAGPQGRVAPAYPISASQHDSTNTQAATPRLPNGRPQPANRLIVPVQASNGRIAQAAPSAQR